MLLSRVVRFGADIVEYLLDCHLCALLVYQRWQFVPSDVCSVLLHSLVTVLVKDYPGSLSVEHEIHVWRPSDRPVIRYYLPVFRFLEGSYISKSEEAREVVHHLEN